MPPWTKGVALGKSLGLIIIVILMLLVMVVGGDLVMTLISLGAENQIQHQNVELASDMTITSAFPEETSLQKRTLLISDCDITFKKDFVRSRIDVQDEDDLTTKTYWNFHKSPTYPRHSWEKNQEVEEPPSGATGISTWYELDDIRNDLHSDYFLENDLDSDTPGYEDIAGPGADDRRGWEPISTFTGSFYGQRKTIGDLYIDRPNEEEVGLFGKTNNAHIKNVGIENLDIKGDENVGGLVGHNIDSYITKSYATGSVKGENRVGGLVGRNWDGYILSSYASVTTRGNTRIGGLVGYNGPSDGGLVYKSYATGSAKGGYERIGGLIGSNVADVYYSYSTGPVSGEEYIGGLAGSNTGSVRDSFWNLATAGISLDEDDGAGEPKTMVEMQDIETFERESTYETWETLENEEEVYCDIPQHEVVDCSMGSCESTPGATDPYCGGCADMDVYKHNRDDEEKDSCEAYVLGLIGCEGPAQLDVKIECSYDSKWYIPEERTIRCGNAIEIKDGRMNRVVEEHADL